MAEKQVWKENEKIIKSRSIYLICFSAGPCEVTVTYANIPILQKVILIRPLCEPERVRVVCPSQVPASVEACILVQLRDAGKGTILVDILHIETMVNATLFTYHLVLLQDISKYYIILNLNLSKWYECNNIHWRFRAFVTLRNSKSEKTLQILVHTM